MVDKRSWMNPSTSFFFKPLNYDFLHNFRIPVSFLKHLEVNYVKSFVAVLKDGSSRPDNGESRVWRVKVNKDTRRFTDRWKDFVHEKRLQVADFLVFRHLGDFVFDVNVFHYVTACLRLTGDVSSQEKADG